MVTGWREESSRLVRPGYAIGRNDDAVTSRERQVLGGLAEGLNLVQIAERMGVTKQRAHQLMRSLERKGVLRQEIDGWWTIVARRSGTKPTGASPIETED
jgi:hypothetical protein